MPEPLVDRQDRLETSESLSYAFLVLLECLSPTRRAVFILREVFDREYVQIASIVKKSVPNCRQIVHRARKNIPTNRSQCDLSHHEQSILIEQFITAWNQENLNKLLDLMAEDLAFYADGGGKVIAAAKPLHGNNRVARFAIAIGRSRLIPSFSSQAILINNRVRILNTIGSQPQRIFSFNFANHKINSIFAVGQSR